MKKTILFTLIVVGLNVSFFARHLASQERIRRRSVQKVLQKAQKQIGIIGNFDLIVDTQDVKKWKRLPNEYPLKKWKRLHNEYPLLFQQRLLFKNTALYKELGEHEANAKLQSAKKLPQQILKTYPKSRAANQARKMLETQRGSEGSADDEPEAIRRKSPFEIK